jgi:polyisoprenoid-binding protein YceI
MKFTKLFFSLSGCVLLVLALFSFTTNDAYFHEGETPGTLTAIGDAGSPNVFTFERWHFSSIEMPDNDPSQIKAVIEIDISSAVCDWKDLEASIKKKKDYFFVRKFPSATVSIDGATLQEDGRYQTEALLNLKGIEKVVTLDFSITEEAPYTVIGEGVIMRREFNFKGDGPKEEVPIAFEAVLPL